MSMSTRHEEFCYHNSVCIKTFVFLKNPIIVFNDCNTYSRIDRKNIGENMAVRDYNSIFPTFWQFYKPLSCLSVRSLKIKRLGYIPTSRGQWWGGKHKNNKQQKRWLWRVGQGGGLFVRTYCSRRPLYHAGVFVMLRLGLIHTCTQLQKPGVDPRQDGIAIVSRRKDTAYPTRLVEKDVHVLCTRTKEIHRKHVYHKVCWSLS